MSDAALAMSESDVADIFNRAAALYEKSKSKQADLIEKPSGAKAIKERERERKQRKRRERAKNASIAESNPKAKAAKAAHFRRIRGVYSLRAAEYGGFAGFVLLADLVANNPIGKPRKESRSAIAARLGFGAGLNGLNATMRDMVALKVVERDQPDIPGFAEDWIPPPTAEILDGRCPPSINRGYAPAPQIAGRAHRFAATFWTNPVPTVGDKGGRTFAVGCRALYTYLCAMCDERDGCTFQLHWLRDAAQYLGVQPRTVRSWFAALLGASEFRRVKEGVWQIVKAAQFCKAKALERKAARRAPPHPKAAHRAQPHETQAPTLQETAQPP